MPDKQEITRRKKNGQWDKGQSGNVSGRPKKNLCITDLLKEIGQEEIDTAKGKEFLMRLVVKKVYELAINGNMRAIEFITERLEGKVPIVEIKSDDDLCEGFTIKWIGSDDKVEKIDHPDGTTEYFGL